jgi:hypothetical protein
MIRPFGGLRCFHWCLSGVQSAEKREELPERLKLINTHFTYSLYINICRSLFEKDKLLFSMLLNVRVMVSQHKLSPDRFSFLLTGGAGLPEVATTNPAPYAPQRRWRVPPTKFIIAQPSAMHLWDRIFNA